MALCTPVIIIFGSELIMEILLNVLDGCVVIMVGNRGRKRHLLPFVDRTDFPNGVGNVERDCVVSEPTGVE